MNQVPHITPIQSLFENSNLELNLNKDADGHYLGEVARYAWMNWMTAYSFGREFQVNIVNKAIQQPEPVEPTCQVRNLDTGELKTMTREAAKLLQTELGDTVEWLVFGAKHEWDGEVFAFDSKVIYTYKQKLKANLVKLNGKLMTREAAVAKYGQTKGAYELWFKPRNGVWTKCSPDFYRLQIRVDSSAGEYELRERPLKQIEWTGSREDVIALVKDMILTGRYL